MSLEHTGDELNNWTGDKESLWLILQGRCHPDPSFWICPSMKPTCVILTTKPFVGYNCTSPLTVCPLDQLCSKAGRWTEQKVFLPLSPMNHQ